MQSSRMATRRQQRSGVFDTFYGKRRGGGWHDANGLWVAAAGAIGTGLSILAGGMFLIA